MRMKSKPRQSQRRMKTQRQC